MYWTCNSINNLLSYFGLVDVRIRASDKDLPVQGDDNNKVINREKATPSPKLDQEDMDILNSIVPEPSIVIVPEPPKQQCGT